MTDRNSIGKRLKQYIKSKNLKQKTVAQGVGVTPGFISQIVNGEEDITMNVVIGLSKSFADLNLDWLLRDEGEMIFEKKEMSVSGGGMVSEPEGAGYKKGVEPSESDVLAGLRAKLEEYEAEIARLRGEVAKFPVLEARIGLLERQLELVMGEVKKKE